MRHHANRGKRFETMLEMSNRHYRLKRVAHIRKTHPEVKFLLNKEGGVRKYWFEKSGGLDFIGSFAGRYLSFDAKSTKSKTAFPLKNVETHQFDELRRVEQFEGTSFLLIHFETLGKTYYLSSQAALDWANQRERKSIPLSWFEGHTKEVVSKDGVLLDYLSIVAEQLQIETN